MPYLNLGRTFGLVGNEVVLGSLNFGLFLCFQGFLGLSSYSSCIRVNEYH